MNNIIARFRKETLPHRLRLYGFILFSSIVLGAGDFAMAAEQQKILLLNSNHAIKKYALTQAAFEAKQQYDITVVDLARSRMNDERLQELVNQNTFQAVYCIGAKAYLLAHQALPEQSIVFSSIMNWRRLPFSEHSYGISQELPVGMQLMMYRYLFPELKKVGVLYSEKYNKEWLDGALQVAQDVGIELVGEDVSKKNDLNTSISSLLQDVEMLWLIADPEVLTDRSSVELVFKLADQAKKPVVTYSEIFVDFGAMLVISADIPTMGGQVATLVKNVIENNAGLHQVRNPVGSHIILNMRQLKRYRISLNKEALGSVNRIIE